jgi:hypothetical protein
MQRAIKYTCSHCRHETYFDPFARLSLHAISESTCTHCGGIGAVITLDIEPPREAAVLDRLPRKQTAALRTAEAGRSV